LEWLENAESEDEEDSEDDRHEYTASLFHHYLQEAYHDHNQDASTGAADRAKVIVMVVQQLNVDGSYEVPRHNERETSPFLRARAAESKEPDFVVRPTLRESTECSQ
jgi:hypothetical protein